MLLEDETTWPPEILHFLEQNQELFDDWYGHAAHAREKRRQPGNHQTTPRFGAVQHDRAVVQLEELLKGYTLSSGYHCTRLTDAEIDAILRSGMQPPNGQTLRTRIRDIEQQQVIRPQDSETLIRTNQADDCYRKGRIWFCFFSPSHAGQHGIERFFRYWGGEALYNSHENNPVTGPILRSIGTPCLIKADVPIASLTMHTSLSFKIIRRFFVNRGLETLEDLDHEDCAVMPIPPHCIREVVKFPMPDFTRLTNCGVWKPELR